MTNASAPEPQTSSGCSSDTLTSWTDPVQIVPAPSGLQSRKSGGGGLRSSGAGGAAKAPGRDREDADHACDQSRGQFAEAEHGELLPSVVAPANRRGGHGETGPTPVDPRVDPCLSAPQGGMFPMRGVRAGRRFAYDPVAALRVAACPSVAVDSPAARSAAPNGSAGSAPPTSGVLTMLDPFSNRHELTQFVDEVSRLSDGALEIRVVTAGHEGADYEAATIRDVQDGRADLALRGAEHGTSSAPVACAPSAPVPRRQLPAPGAVLTSGLVDSMLEELQPLGLVGIGILPGPIRRPLGVEHAGGTERLPRADDRHPAVTTWPTRPCARSAPARSDSPPMSPASPGSDGIEHSRSPPSRSAVSTRTVRT